MAGGLPRIIRIENMRNCKQTVWGAALAAAALWLPITATNAQWAAKLIAVPKINIRVYLGESSRTAFLDLIRVYAKREHFQIDR